MILNEWHEYLLIFVTTTAIWAYKVIFILFDTHCLHLSVYLQHSKFHKNWDGDLKAHIIHSISSHTAEKIRIATTVSIFMGAKSQCRVSVLVNGQSVKAYSTPRLETHTLSRGRTLSLPLSLSLYNLFPTITMLQVYWILPEQFVKLKKEAKINCETCPQYVKAFFTTKWLRLQFHIGLIRGLSTFITFGGERWRIVLTWCIYILVILLEKLTETFFALFINT